MRVALCAFRRRRTRRPQALQRVRGPLRVMVRWASHASGASIAVATLERCAEAAGAIKEQEVTEQSVRKTADGWCRQMLSPREVDARTYYSLLRHSGLSVVPQLRQRSPASSAAGAAAACIVCARFAAGAAEAMGASRGVLRRSDAESGTRAAISIPGAEANWARFGLRGAPHLPAEFPNSVSKIVSSGRAPRPPGCTQQSSNYGSAAQCGGTDLLNAIRIEHPIRRFDFLEVSGAPRCASRGGGVGLRDPYPQVAAADVGDADADQLIDCLTGMTTSPDCSVAVSHTSPRCAMHSCTAEQTATQGAAQRF